MSLPPFVRSFSDITRADIARVGGKNASLPERRASDTVEGQGPGPSCFDRCCRWLSTNGAP
jgi:hypothetical protein